MDHSRLLTWYEHQVRPFLATQGKDRTASLDNDRDRLKRLLQDRDAITVCFLGNSGIGKSTLINALAAGEKQVLPAGGIGPLTAQATEVHFSETASFSVVYHKRGKLMQLGFALERRFERISKQTSAIASAFTEDLAPEDQKELIDEERDIEAGPEAKESSDPFDSYIKQARLLVTGDQFSQKPLAYLIYAIQLACGGKPRSDLELDTSDLERVSRIKEVLDFAKTAKVHVERQDGDAEMFSRRLVDHAAGFLSPLIQRIEVGWPSDLLSQGVILVDLPGVGIAQDTYREITKKYVREQARALVLVVDRAGPTDATIDLLRTSGYWDRLVGAADDPAADPCHLLIAVTRVDDVATSEWANLPKDGRPKKKDVFADRVESFRPRIRDQIKEQLGRLTTSQNETVQTARQAAVANLLEYLQVHPVSAPEYRRLLAGDDDDCSFLLSVDATRIPALSQTLAEMSAQERAARRRAIDEVSARLVRSLLGELGMIRALWQDREKAVAEADRLRATLDVMIGPKEKEYALRVGAFREFLSSTIQTRIRELVLEARVEAEIEVNNYLISLRNEHWATLRATVRRGGVWLWGRGRAVNLPDDISTLFQEPTAAVWSQKLLKDIRKRTAELAKDISDMVEEVCDWARNNGGTTVNREVLAQQNQRVADHAAQLRQVGREAIEDLRDIVKKKLTDVIKNPIKKACDEFVEHGDDVGSGVKRRILSLFEHLARTATGAAEKPAIDVLQRNSQVVREEIRVAFEEWGDPLQDTANLIVERHEDRVKRADAQRRGKVLSEIESILKQNPVTDAVVG